MKFPTNCKGFQDNPQILNFLSCILLVWENVCISNSAKVLEIEVIFPLSSCVEWLRNQLGDWQN